MSATQAESALHSDCLRPDDRLAAPSARTAEHEELLVGSSGLQVPDLRQVRGG